MTADTSQVRNLARNLQKSGLFVGFTYKQLVMVSARAIVADAKQRVPVGHGANNDEAPGALRDSIHARYFWGASATVIADSRRRDGQEYGWAVEYGTSRTPAQPFLSPAADRERGHFFDSAEKAAQEALDRL